MRHLPYFLLSTWDENMLVSSMRAWETSPKTVWG
jgi:hypothetical protein